jgi:hypothetical protein
MSEYLKLRFDNLSRTANLLEGLMGELDEDQSEELEAKFDKMFLEKKQTVDERALTIRSLENCEKDIAAHKKVIDAQLKRVRKIQSKLKKDTLETIKEFDNQPFRGNYCELKSAKTKGKVELGLYSSKISIANVIAPDLYAQTDIPSSCLGKVTYYYVKKDELYSELKGGLEIKDAKLVDNKSLRIKELLP